MKERAPLYPEGPQIDLVKSAWDGEACAVRVRNVLGRIADWADRAEPSAQSQQQIAVHLVALQRDLKMLHEAIATVERHYEQAQMRGEEVWI